MTKWLLVAALCAACGGDDGGSGNDSAPFLATYSTTSHTRASNPGSTVSCTDLGDAVADAAPYFQIEVDPFFMDPSELTVVDCPDSTGANCEETMVPLAASDNGLEAESYNTQTGGGFACQLYYQRATAILDGNDVTVMFLMKYDDPDIDMADCTLDMAKALADSADCESVEVWRGTKL